MTNDQQTVLLTVAAFIGAFLSMAIGLYRRGKRKLREEEACIRRIISGELKKQRKDMASHPWKEMASRPNKSGRIDLEDL